MAEYPFQVGDRVIAEYKSGQYIAEICELQPPKATVKVLAVCKHPLQGDLHHPHRTAVRVFHQRRALAYQEKVMLPLGLLKSYHGEVLDYQESLRQALAREKAELEKQGGEWAERSLEALRSLEVDYFPGR